MMKKEEERGKLGFLASPSRQQFTGILGTRTGARGTLG